MKIDVAIVEELLAAIKADDEMSAQMLLSELTKTSESEVIHQVEEIASNLQNTLQGFGEDAELLLQTKHDLPDVSERLEYVIQTTEEASSQTLQAAENMLAVVETMQTKLAAGEKVDAELAELQQESTNIMMSQSFQDLTGQVLNRVMMLVGSLEASLMMLIQQSGIDYQAIPERQISDDEQKSREMQGVGPNVTKSSKDNIVDSQEGVDDLLADLGI